MDEMETVERFKETYVELFDFLQYLKEHFSSQPGSENLFRAYWVEEKLERLVNEVEGLKLDIVDSDIQRFFRTTIPAYKETPGMKIYHDIDFVQKMKLRMKDFAAGMRWSS